MVQLRMRLAKFIRDQRGDATQREFARKIGVAQSTIMRIENVDQNVTIDTLERLCRIFRVDVGELFPHIPAPKIYPRVERTLGLIHEDKASTTPAKPSTKKPAKKSSKRRS